MKNAPVSTLTESAVIAACKDAKAALDQAAFKAVIAGQLLLEHRDSLSRTSHNAKSSVHGRNQHSDGDGFLKFVGRIGISKDTAYRWMDIAGRVARLQLGLGTADDAPVCIDVESEIVSLSQALTAPEKELSKQALKFRQDVFDFMADKTLSEALAACVDGESDPKRITLAASGKTKGGKGGDRKAFDKFTAQKLQHLTTFFGHKLTVSQKGEIVAGFNRTLEKWPRWILEALAEKCKSELKLGDQERGDRKQEF